MASETSTPVASGGNIEVLSWLRNLPVAPEYHPTLAEFQDPIAYIFKIEKEASKYGICKIVPPVPAQSKKTFLSNLNKSLLARSSTGSPTFTTRQQQIGFCPRKHHPVQKPVWQSGEYYTLPEFEAKAKGFEKTYLRKCTKKNLTALEVETLYWKAIVDKPFSVEYANDMPGSAFAVRKAKAVREGGGEINANASIAETEWNMRGVSRAKGSLLKFMKEEIPGVTSPMVYVAMMFSWFAWHVEDHDLHSLNYLHTGSGKTWYGVPRDAASAFEEVIRAHGYGGEINPLVTFATLGEKTTVMSPEVLFNAGVPCCRLVQNAGEFVVTFPRAYHSGFSHGFNCGEAANIATPGWLTVATEAAIRRASINCPPMVSHFQLLYDLVLSSCSRIAKSVHMEPRSSRLKDKQRGEGDMLVKEFFIQDVLQNSNLLHVLAKGSPVIVLPQTSAGSSFCLQTIKSSFAKEVASQKGGLGGTGSYAMRNKHTPLSLDKRPLFSGRGLETSLASESKNMGNGQDRPWADRSSDQGLFSCVTCGILCFACVAIVQPTDVAARYLLTADCSQFKDWADNSDIITANRDGDLPKSDSFPVRWMNKRNRDGLFDVPVEAAGPLESTDSHIQGPSSNADIQKGASSLGLLALAYGNSSDSEEDDGESVISNEACKNRPVESSAESELDCYDNVENLGGRSTSYLEVNVTDEVPLQVTCSDQGNPESRTHGYLDGSFEHDSCRFFTTMDSGNLTDRSRHQIESLDASPNFSPIAPKAEHAMTTTLEHFRNKQFPRTTRPDEDSSRMHVFCLQHAVQVEKLLRSIGGAHVLLLCHPDYPKVEDHAKKMAEESGNDYAWSANSYREASQDDEEIIQLALQSEEALHGNGDWAVKLGMNLFYSANLSRSPLYCKQMPYNYVIYTAFGRNSSTSDLTTGDPLGRGQGRQRKILVAGKWCGKVWMSNQVHPLLVKRDLEEEQPRNIPSHMKPALKSVLKSNKETDDKPEISLRKSRILPAETTSITARPDKSLRKSRIPTAEMTSISSKTGKKRKTTADIRPNVKAKSAKVEEQGESFEDSSIGLALMLRKSNQTKKRTTRENPEPLDRGVKNRKQLNVEPLDRSTKNRKQLNFEPIDRGVKNRNKLHLEPLDRGVKNRKQLNLEPLDRGGKNRKQLNLESEEEEEGGVSSRLRKRPEKPVKDQKPKSDKPKPVAKKPQAGATAKKSSAGSGKAKLKEEKAEYPCELDGCSMSFGTKQELVLHKRNICPVKGCGKKFFSHKYLVQHRRVHMDDRPLKCPWKGCKMSFKWAWARTEHIRVHTGDRPYVCDEAGCGQTFRFVSDFSRHKRKTGHCIAKRGRG